MDIKTVLVAGFIIFVLVAFFAYRKGKSSSDGAPTTIQEFFKRLRKSRRMQAKVLSTTPYTPPAYGSDTMYYVLARLGSEVFSFSICLADIPSTDTTALVDYRKNLTNRYYQIAFLALDKKDGKVAFTDENNNELFRV